MILVFGGRGQLGQELAAAAARMGTALVGLGREVDVSDRNEVAGAIDRERAHLVVNAAAFTRADAAERDVVSAERGNVAGAANVAAECARRDIPLVHISTDYVFDGEKGAPYVEEDAPNPINRYGVTKLAGEIAIRNGGSRHVILRSGWLFGAFGNNFLVRFLARAEAAEPLRVVSDRFGSPVAASDLAGAILGIAPALQSWPATDGRWGTYHFGGPERLTWHALASHALAVRARLVGGLPELQAISSAEFPTAARRPRDTTLDSRRFASTFGFSAQPWRPAVERAVAQLVPPRA